MAKKERARFMKKPSNLVASLISPGILERVLIALKDRTTLPYPRSMTISVMDSTALPKEAL